MEENKKHPHSGHRQRFKNKAFDGGIEYWPQHEVMELILMYAIPQKDVNPLAHDLINRFGSIANVLDAGYEQLRDVKGVGHEVALYLTLLPEIFDRYLASKDTDSVVLNTPADCVNHFRHINRVREVEEFYIFCLDIKKRLIKTVKMDGGLSASISVSLSSFAKEIAFDACKSIIIMHTHPGGDPQPTQSDINSTRRLMHSAMSVGVRLEDHVIVSDKSYYSFLKNDIIDDMFNQVSALFNQRIHIGDKIDE